MSLNQRRTGTIVKGVSITSTGEATVDPAVTNLLFDLAIRLEESTDLPVDIEHVLAAVVLAAQQGKIDVETNLSVDDSDLVSILENEVKRVFAEFGGKVGQDD